MGESTRTDGAALARLEGVDAFVQQVMADWNVPGAAVGVVKDGEVIYQGGVGLRDTSHGLPVTPHTVFAIGSCTKAFTALDCAILVDEGRLGWDVPVRTYVPTFTMRDPVASERMTVRDLLTHRSGLPRHDLVHLGAPWTRAELVACLQYLEPSADFRTTYQYNNLLYAAAGYLVGVVTGKSWEEFTRVRLLEPLGMTDSNFSVTVSQQVQDAARPYGEKDGAIQEIPFRNTDALAPCGAINSSIADMCRWLLLQLNSGRYGDQPLVSAEQHAQTQTPQMVRPAAGKYPEMPGPETYGLGWAILPYRGRLLLTHGGSVDGFSSIVSLLPAEKIGVVVLANTVGDLPGIVARTVCDRLLGVEPAPWNERAKGEREETRSTAEREAARADEARVAGTQSSHPLDAYTGEYVHPGYGTFSVRHEAHGLQALFHESSGSLQHYHYDTFEMGIQVFWWTIRARITFHTNARGEVACLSVPLEPAVKDIVFTRVSTQS